MSEINKINVNEQFKYLNIGLPDRILREKIYGNFDAATEMIDVLLDSGKGTEGFRACLRVQKEIIARLPEDYPYTFDEAVELVQSHIPDFTAEELRGLEKEGRVDWIYIDGVPHYFSAFFANMCETDDSYAARAGKIKRGGDNGNFDYRHEILKKLKENGELVNRIKIRASVRIHDNEFKAGEKVLVHLPIPAACEEQSDIRIEAMFPENGVIDDENVEQRTVSWKETMTENHEFSVEYSYTYRLTYNDVWNAAADKEQPAFFTDEKAPHIVFTPYIRDLAAALTEGAEDNLEKAKRFYKFVTENVNYSFSREYFGLESIAESCARNLVGDCGIQTLLFITLCRCAGIPARWESGFAAGPDRCGSHDWAKIYVAPLGWFHVDCSRGGSAFRQGDELLHKFYFGNIAGDAMVANREFQGDFKVVKSHWRADPYDNQVGEIETESRGLRYSQFDSIRTVVEFEKII